MPKLLPSRTKYRKVHKGRVRGVASRGNSVSFGEFGIQSLSRGRMTSNQIEAARVAINRHLKRKGKVWIRVFPHKPVTKKPAETRQGKGKGPVDHWVAVIKPGHVLFEIAGCSLTLAREALGLADAKLPFAAVSLPVKHPTNFQMKMSEIKDLSLPELNKKLRELGEDLLKLQVRKQTGQVERPHVIKQIRRDRARILTKVNQLSQATTSNS